MKTLSKLLLVLGLAFWGFNTAGAQNSLRDDKAGKAEEVKGFVQGKNYVFEATGKGSMNMGYHKYDVSLAKDTLVASLPGKNGPVKFDCTNYSYNSWRTKDGNWQVIIKPASNMNGVKEMKMDITPQGHASLTIMTYHHGPMQLDGYIKQSDY
jgi:hypothetical protein